MRTAQRAHLKVEEGVAHAQVATAPNHHRGLAACSILALAGANAGRTDALVISQFCRELPRTTVVPYRTPRIETAVRLTP